jgi:hypothetical protein
MTRSILSGLLGLLSIGAIAGLPLACQSSGVGDPCIPEDEYNPDFAGFKVSEENIESRSFQCSTRICLVNHFQGRVTCPLGQDALSTDGSTGRKACNGTNDTSTCGTGSACVEASTFAPDCDPNVKNACPAGMACDKARKVCACISGAVPPDPNFHCVKSDPKDAKSLDVFRSFVCHKKNNCQQAGAAQKDNEVSGTPKDCCVPGTDTPTTASVCGQCDAKHNRNADNAVYCSCRCDVVDGQTRDPNFNYCACPTGFTCSLIRRDVGLGDPQLSGKYCIREGSDFTGTPNECGSVHGHWDATCGGQASLN